MKKFLYIVATFCLLPLVSQAQMLAPSPSETESVQQLQKLNQFYRYLTAAYVEEVDTAPLVEKAIGAMLAELDPHSAYISREEMESMQVQMEGEFSGVGIEFTVMRDTLTVANTIAGAPAESVGVRSGDRIVKIDGTSAIGIATSDVSKRLRGKTGTKVDVEIVRRNVVEPLTFTITRDKIPVNTVDAAYMATPQIGYIKINRFGHKTAEEFAQAVQKLSRAKSYIIDLRGNGGGVMSAAVDIAEMFLPKGAVIVSTEGRAMPPQSERSSRSGDDSSNVVVLIDESSASASEILAGALQDWDRALIVGRNSFGKGLVQRVIPFRDGSAVRLTVSRYHTPSGRVIQRHYEKGNSEAYYAAYRDRVLHADSVALAAKRDTMPRPEYKTLRLGRTVYGGGGIVPDVVINADTMRAERYLLEVVGRGVLASYMWNYIDAQRAQLLKAYPTFDEFAARYKVSEQMFEALAADARKGGITVDEAEERSSRDVLERYIRALTARRLYSATEYYRVLNAADDREFAEAVQILSDWLHRGKPILQR